VFVYWLLARRSACEALSVHCSRRSSAAVTGSPDVIHVNANSISLTLARMEKLQSSHRNLAAKSSILSVIWQANIARSKGLTLQIFSQYLSSYPEKRSNPCSTLEIVCVRDDQFMSHFI
jgi:hypothetical protein